MERAGTARRSGMTDGSAAGVAADGRGGTEGRDLARALYDALATGDADRLATLLHPEFAGRTTEGLPFDLGGADDGPEARTRDFWGAIGRPYRARAEPERFLPLVDGDLLVLGRYTGTARDGDGVLD